MLKPRLLLLDEPFSAVDPITRVGIYKRFREVQAQEGVSTLLVTHDMREAVKLAQVLVIIAAGQIAQAGPVAEVLANPRTDYVAELLQGQLD
jgi:osmoprotectant transport system ATP-binding protein